MPANLKAKKTTINVLNNDNECFKWVVTSALYPVDKHSDRKTKYIDKSKKLDWTGITFPTKLKDIKTFEKHTSIAVNILGYDKTDNIYSLRISNNKSERAISLPLIDNGTKQHHCWIKI